MTPGGRWTRDLENRKKAITAEYKRSKGCARCPEGDARCLDLRHLDPADKHPILKKTGGAWWKLSYVDLYAEFEKCIVLCANCHRKEHG
jgi:hypothetical protein